MLSDIHLLGTVQRAFLHPAIASRDLIGLSYIYFSHLFPINLQTVHIAVSGPIEALEGLVGSSLIAEIAENPTIRGVATFEAAVEHSEKNGGTAPPIIMVARADQSDGLPRPRSVQILPLPALSIDSPCSVVLRLASDGEEVCLGRIDLRFLEPQPLAFSELQALKSRVGSLKEIAIMLQCTICADHVKLVSAADPDERPNDLSSSRIWLRDAAEKWTCRCGKATVNTFYIKKAMPAFFRDDSSIAVGPSPVSGVRLYQDRVIQTLLGAYHDLINASPSEEAVQVFLQDHPLLWSFLSPVAILHKPSILTQHKADFAILSAAKTLYLVEIEKPSTKLMKSNGGMSSELQAGFDQIRDWRVIVANHRSSLLSELGFSAEQVHHIRFIVVAGLAHAVSQDTLHKFRLTCNSEADFYSFDDLEAFVHRLRGALSTL